MFFKCSYISLYWADIGDLILVHQCNMDKAFHPYWCRSLGFSKGVLFCLTLKCSVHTMMGHATGLGHSRRYKILSLLKCHFAIELAIKPVNSTTLISFNQSSLSIGLRNGVWGFSPRHFGFVCPLRCHFVQSESLVSAFLGPPFNGHIFSEHPYYTLIKFKFLIIVTSRFT
jgi:hypothetical protein